MNCADYYIEWKSRPKIVVHKTNKKLSYNDELMGFHRCEGCNMVYNAENCLLDFEIDYCPACGYDPYNKKIHIPCNCEIINDEMNLGE